MEEEFGNFDTSAFGEKKQKACNQMKELYSAQICEPNWFLEDSSLELIDNEEKMQILKFRGELAYYTSNYSKALHFFGLSLDLVKSSNATLQRDLMESISRSYLALKRPKDALHTALHLFAESKTVEQKGNTLLLIIVCFKALNVFQAEVVCIKRLLLLHPSNPDLWIQLAEALSNETTDIKSPESYINLSNQEDCKMCCDLIMKNFSDKSEKSKDSGSAMKCIPVVHILNNNCTCIEIVKNSWLEQITSKLKSVLDVTSAEVDSKTDKKCELSMCLQRAQYLLKNIEINVADLSQDKYHRLTVHVQKQMEIMGVTEEAPHSENTRDEVSEDENAARQAKTVEIDASDNKITAWFKWKWFRRK